MLKDKREADLKDILTPEQFAKMEKMREDRKEGKDKDHKEKPKGKEKPHNE